MRYLMLVAAITSVLVACSPPAVKVGDPCSADSDCANSSLALVCKDGKCAENKISCFSQENCIVDGSSLAMLCLKGTCQQVSCEKDIDCDAGQVCKSGSCHFNPVDCNNHDDCNKDAQYRKFATMCREGICIRRLCQFVTGCNKPWRECYACGSGQYCEFGFKKTSEGEDEVDQQTSFCRFDKPSSEETHNETPPEDGGTETPPETTPEPQPECQNGTMKPCITQKLIDVCKPDISGYSCKGECKTGFTKCVDGRWSEICMGVVEPTKEICGDKKDNDCDGVIDNPTICNPAECKDGDTRQCYTGKAGCDSKYNCIGVCKAGKESCIDGKWSRICEGEIKPSPEICDTKDNDCNGKVDDGLSNSCQCLSGQSRSCYSHGTTRGIGECKEGSQSCENNQWGECKNEITPTSEICDNKDNDCNGKIDDGLSKSCFTGSYLKRNVGECKDGIQTCNAGQWGECKNQTLPTDETCDNKDNNCDGFIDEGLKRLCNTGKKGVCETGLQICSAGQWGSCMQGIQPSTEKCDGNDNDCNGVIDDIAPTPCFSGTIQAQGECKAGVAKCQGGKTICFGEILPTKETCDGKDNDCNGKVDDGLGSSCVCKPGETRACYTADTKTKNVGPCKEGSQTCNNGTWGTCNNEILPKTEVCDDKIDNDCNGQIDDPAICTTTICTPGETRECYTGANGCTKNGNTYTCIGTCKTGKQTCDSSGKSWGTCNSTMVTPSTEIANGKDDDCDGLIDEGTSHPTFKLVGISPNCPTTTYKSGSPTSETGRDASAETQYDRCFTNKQILVSIYETKVSEFKAVMGYDPSGEGCGNDCPVENITWHEAAAFANKLSTAHGLSNCYTCTGSQQTTTCTITTKAYYTCKGYRLPTSFEWEYLARAGAAGPFPGTPSIDYANCGSGTLAKVGLKKPNAWGLYDMNGNVREWVADLFITAPLSDRTDPIQLKTSPSREMRGGHFRNSPKDCRNATRVGFSPTTRNSVNGVRLVRTLQ